MNIMNGKFLCTSSRFLPHTLSTPGCGTAVDKSTVKPCCYPHKNGYITQVPLTSKHRCAHIWTFIYERSYMVTHMCESIYEPIYEDMSPICSLRFVRFIYKHPYMRAHIWTLSILRIPIIIPEIMFIYVLPYVMTHICVHIYGCTYMSVHIWVTIYGYPYMNGYERKIRCTSFGSRHRTFLAPGCQRPKAKFTVTPRLQPLKIGYKTQKQLTSSYMCTHIWVFIYGVPYMRVHIGLHIYELIMTIYEYVNHEYDELTCDEYEIWSQMWYMTVKTYMVHWDVHIWTKCALIWVIIYGSTYMNKNGPYMVLQINHICFWKIGPYMNHP